LNLKELARQLGLSQTTVSRALNGYPEVSERTRERVREAALATGYQPSRTARRLATGRSRVLGNVVARSRHGLLGPHFSDVIAGIGQASGQLGYDAQLSIVDDATQASLYRELAADGSVDGVIVHGPTVDDSRIELLSSLDLPFVMHGRAGDECGYTWLDVDNRHAIRRATGLLLDLGHRDVALLNGDESFGYAARRRRGFDEAFDERAQACPPARYFTGFPTEAYGHDTVAALLDGDESPTAAVVGGLLPAHGALRALQDRGLTLGRDFSIVAYDDRLTWLENGGEFPLFTALRSSIERAGRRLVELLVERIEDRAIPPVGELWEAELVLGRSTGPPGGRRPRKRGKG